MRTSNWPPSWQPLVKAVSDDAGHEDKTPQQYICDTLEIAPGTFNKKRKGENPFSEEEKKALAILASRYSVPNPVEGKTVRYTKNLVPLRQLGERIEAGWPPGPLEKYFDMYTEEHLVELADSDAPPQILEACRVLLDSYPKKK